MIFTALQVTHYWDGSSKPNNLRHETSSLVDYCDWITKTVAYWEMELVHGADDNIQSCTLETGAGMPDIGIAIDLDGKVTVMELNISY